MRRGGKWLTAPLLHTRHVARAAVSQRLFDKLRAKRFGQIFEYLDVEGAGLLDLVALVRRPTAHMDNLDNEVRRRRARHTTPRGHARPRC